MRPFATREDGWVVGGGVRMRPFATPEATNTFRVILKGWADRGNPSNLCREKGTIAHLSSPENLEQVLSVACEITYHPRGK